MDSQCFLSPILADVDVVASQAAEVDVQLVQLGLDASPSPEDRIARVLRSIVLWMGHTIRSSEHAQRES